MSRPIEIKLRGNKIKTIDAEVFGHFAVHRFDEGFCTGWRVTHIPSGAAVRDFPTPEAADAMAQKLDAVKIPGVEKVRIRSLKSGKVRITDPEGAMEGMAAILRGGSLA